MEKEGKSEKERDFLLQWGNRKRLRCVKVKKDQNLNNNNNNNNNNDKSSLDCLDKKKVITSRIVSSPKDSSSLQQRLNKNLGSPTNNRKPAALSPEKEDRYYTTRGSLGLDENGKMLGLDHHNGHLGDIKRNNVWPKLFLSLSSKEKEEDFMAMKGCKLPQRPKKRAKFLQKSLLLVMPGSWLSDLCQERYEVREKKASKKRPRGLKAMGSMESDSE
ncbi:hypothetical protein L484_019117 [Morus notabilis]|uniref:DUF1639 domain-containing protein n=1 Tax=Morus notabilis TaxID=981085 RepID=W9SZI5_9ROSA|nr:suppressor of Mek1 [Morus notabilis]XP_024032015.1 suppressor of Mek1 [Morus notabilis]EXC34520.1 hypothetical protein L484_019117 [Morus notabilis]